MLYGKVVVLDLCEMDLENAIDEKCAFLNYPIKSSVKVQSCFEQITFEDCRTYKAFVDDVLKIDLWTGDYFGKILIISLKLLSDYDLLFTGAAGLSFTSIENIIIFYEDFERENQDSNYNKIILIGFKKSKTGALS